MLIPGVGAVVAGAVVTTLAGVWAVPALRRWRWRQFIREQGPETHRVKSGTPTLGGILFLLPLLLAGQVLGWNRPDVAVLVFLALGYGLLGASDDLRKILGGRSLGLRAREKLVVQALLGLVFAGIILWHPQLDPRLFVPGLGLSLDLGWLYIPFVLLVIVGTTNTVNLTDGLDGLAAGTVAIALLVFGYLSWTYGTPDVALVCWAVAGGALGFLWFNTHPALVFMGDTGAFLLGAVLSGAALLSGTVLWLPLVGGIFVLEGLSDIVQVLVFRRTGRRILRMAPLHHHFELMGWPEPRVVVRFWLTGGLLGGLGLLLA